MPAASRLNDNCSGHSCFPPRPITSASGDFFWNGIGAARVGDTLATHRCGKSSHPGTITAGSSTFFINGKQAAFISSQVNCGSVVAEGSADVFLG